LFALFNSIIINLHNENLTILEQTFVRLKNIKSNFVYREVYSFHIEVYEL